MWQNHLGLRAKRWQYFCNLPDNGLKRTAFSGDGDLLRKRPRGRAPQRGSEHFRHEHDQTPKSIATSWIRTPNHSQLHRNANLSGAGTTQSLPASARPNPCSSPTAACALVTYYRDLERARASCATKLVSLGQKNYRKPLQGARHGGRATGAP